MRKILLVIFFASACIQLLAQKGKMKLAENYFNTFQYISAANVYEEILRDDSANHTITTKLVDCYAKLNNSEREEYFLSKVCNQYNTDFKYFKRYAETLAKNGKYNESVKWYQKYGEASHDTKAAQYIASYSNVNIFNTRSTLYHVKPLELNSTSADFSPTFYQDGIVFCSARNKSKKFKWDGSAFIDLYYSNESATSVAPLDNTINSSLHEGPATFTENFDTIFFTRNDQSTLKTSEDKVVKLNIFYSIKKQGGWSTARKLELSDGNCSMGHPTLSPDHKLYFVSDKAGGLGGTDIYYTKLENGKWIAPVNLGPQINTSENEMFPFIDQKGSLYFASNGYPTLGGLDVFYSKFNGSNFSTPENLGAPVNSSKDDFGFIIKDNKGYFSSNRGENHKDDNIFSVMVEKSKVMSIQAVDINKHPLTSFTVSVKTTSDSSLATSPKTVEAIYAQILSVDNSYGIKVSKEGFKENTFLLSSDDLLKYSSKDTIKVQLEKLIVNKTIFVELISSNKERLTGGIVELKNASDERIEKATTSKEVVPSFLLQSGNRYEITASRKDFKTKSVDINLDTLSDQSTITIILASANTLFDENTLGQIIEMDIKYDRSKFNIRPDAAKELNRLVNHLKKYPNVKVELGSHTDNRGADEDNFKLSQKRAESAVNYIVGKGISSSRLIPMGYGEKDLKVENATTEEEHQQNRRTTVKIVGI